MRIFSLKLTMLIQCSLMLFAGINYSVALVKNAEDLAVDNGDNRDEINSINFTVQGD